MKRRRFFSVMAGAAYMLAEPSKARSQNKE
jgi:hypothetical protein